MDRPPKAAPFRRGTKLRYKGTHESWTYDIDPKTRERKLVPLCVPGLIVTIAETRPGRRGTLVHLRDADGPMHYDDTGEPILDETQDGYSVYFVEAWQNGRKQGRASFPTPSPCKSGRLCCFQALKIRKSMACRHKVRPRVRKPWQSAQHNPVR